jgi:hypothetical protein
LGQEDLARIAAALRYMGRDLLQRSYGVSAERRELLWQEMDRCLELAARIEPDEAPAELADPADATSSALITGASSGVGAAAGAQPGWQEDDPGAHGPAAGAAGGTGD